MPSNKLDIEFWIDNYADYFLSYAYYKVGKKEEAEDLVQETFLSAYKSRDTFNGSVLEKTWLMAILKNKIIDFYRKSKDVKSFSDYANQTESSFENSFFNNDNYGRWKGGIGENYFSTAADNYVLGKEFQQFLKICLEKMPTKLRSIFIAKYIDDEKTEDICKSHEITPANYWVIIFRSKTLLRNCLVQKGVME